MPYRDPEMNRRRSRENMRRLRADRKAKRLAAAPASIDPGKISDPGQAIAEWSKRVLVVPPGHFSLSGEAMELPAFLTAFLSDALQPSIQESALWISRKNAKSAAIAVCALAHLIGPLRTRGWRAALVSLNKGKANELRTQIEQIAVASDLDGIQFRRSPYPGKIVSEWGTIEVLSAEKHAGHSGGYHAVFCDETGLFSERDRALLAGLRSSISAHAGKLIHISIFGNGLFTGELSARKSDPSVVIHEHRADDNARLDDRVQWLKANPALAAGIKSLDYMESASRRALGNAAEQRYFRAHDLNQTLDPGAEMIVGLDDWLRCLDKPEAPREGPATVGFDAGYTKSFTTGAAYWPQTGRLEVVGAVGGVPSLEIRGEADGVGSRYERMREAGLLKVFRGVRITPIQSFLEWFAGQHLAGVEVLAGACDRVRKAEIEDVLAKVGVSWPMEFRASGLGPDGITDTSTFQNLVVSEKLRPSPRPHILLESAIQQSKLRFDGNGNCSLNKATQTSRIDALSAAILACGLGQRLGSTPFSIA